MKQKRKSSLSSLENQPLNAVTPEALQDRKEFKKMLMDQVRTSGGTSAVDTKQIFQGLVKDTLEAFLELEMEEHLGYPKHDAEGRNSGNSRNGASSTTVRGDFGEVEIDTPRDRNASFEPKVVAKRQTSVGKFSEAVISLYTRGLSTREIEQHVKEIYGLDISPQFVSRVTEELRQQIVEWQNRPLGRVYPTSVAAWRTHWNELTTFFRYPVELRRIIYTTNAIESLHSQMRKNIASRKVFPNDESVVKILFLNIRNFTNRWTRRQGWDMVMSQLLVLFRDRLKSDLIDSL